MLCLSKIIIIYGLLSVKNISENIFWRVMKDILNNDFLNILKWAYENSKVILPYGTFTIRGLKKRSVQVASFFRWAAAGRPGDISMR